jgi:hypothetical protein
LESVAGVPCGRDCAKNRFIADVSADGDIRLRLRNIRKSISLTIVASARII